MSISKLEKLETSNLYRTINRVKSDYSFTHKKKPWTFRDLLKGVGLDDAGIAANEYREPQLSQPITFDDVKEFCHDLEISHKTKWWLIHNPPQPDENFPPQSTATQEVGHNEGATINLDPRVEYSTGAKAGAGAEKEDSENAETTANYGFTPTAEEIKLKTTLFWFQKKGCMEMYDGIVKHNKRGQLLLAGVGTGKTFMYGALLARLINDNFHEGKTFTPFPYVVVTKASIVEQTKRVLFNKFGISEDLVLVTNYDQLRSKFGELFVKEHIDIIRGEEHYTWKWRKNINPVVIVWDECQSLKNLDSLQSKIGQSFNEIDSRFTWQIFSSATPFTRVIEAKCFSVATRVKHDYGVARNIELTNAHFLDFAQVICGPDIKPEEHSPSAINHLIDVLDDFIIRVKNVRTQFKPINSVKMIDFANEEDRLYYEEAYNRYLAEKATIEAEGQGSRFQILVEFLKFRQAAELIRAPYLAQAMYHSVQEGQAAVASLNFKNTITKIVKILIEDYKVPRSQISLIWGGAAKASKKQKAKAKLDVNEDMRAEMEELGISLEDLNLDDVEEMKEFNIDIPDEYKLGSQNLKERQKEIDKFQSGKSLYCLFTFRAGGVGLSLHHTDELTKEKARRKPSGYVIEEDIQTIPTRPRINFVAPTYSAIELVQGLGRCARLTSLSDTPQLLVFYRGTIEARVAAIVSMKLRCLTKVVRQKESWESCIVGQDKAEAVQQKYLNSSNNEPDDSDDELLGDNPGEE